MYHIKSYYGEDHKKYSKEEYETVYKEFAPMLKDQSMENLEIFEILLGDLPDTQLYDDVELLESGEKDRCFTYDLVESMNNYHYKKKSLEDFLEVVIKEFYGNGANYLLFEMYHEMGIINQDTLVDLFEALVDKFIEVDNPYDGYGENIFSMTNWFDASFVIYYYA